MSRIAVIGGGFGGLAAAARLAKLGHRVTLLERSARLGGALTSETAAGYTWDAGPHLTLLPAVVRDLFRKSGRPLERELELVELPVIREHRFADGSTVALPGSSRAAQVAAFDELGSGLGHAWVEYVAAYNPVWESLRRNYLEVPWDSDTMPVEASRLLGSREMLAKRMRRALPDRRLRLVAGHPFAADGHDPRDVPAWMGLVAYLEQRFGAWRVPGGMARLGDVLADRMATRKVEVRTGTPATDVVVSGGRAVAVRTTAGDVDTDLVVCAIDPRRLPALAGHVERTVPALPPTVCHVGLTGEVPDLPPEVVLHGKRATLTVRTTGTPAADGSAAWTIHARGRLDDDLLFALGRHGLDIRNQVVVRRDHSPKDLVERWGGSPLGLLWQGRGTVRHRLGPDTPVPGVYAAGAHASPAGACLPFVGLSSAVVAHAIGPA